MAGLEEVETERLRGAALAFGHREALARMYADPRVMATLGGKLFGAEESLAVLERGRRHWEEHGFGTWVFFAREDGRFVGRGGMHRFEIDGASEVGLIYHVAAEEWGRGFASEIARCALEVAFGPLGLAAVMSWTLPHNRASRRVMEKCGLAFEREGTFAELPHVFYRVAADEWAQRRS